MVVFIVHQLYKIDVIARIFTLVYLRLLIGHVYIHVTENMIKINSHSKRNRVIINV